MAFEKKLSTQVTVLLHGIEGPINLGAIARAMANTGFHQLRWTGQVAPDHPEALKFSVHAAPILENGQKVSSFSELTQSTDVLFGFTPRRPWQDGRNLDIHGFLEKLGDALAAGKKVGLLFGNEARGLDNAALARCDGRVALPTDSSYSSLNLSQAVLLACWEIRRRWVTNPIERQEPESIGAEEKRVLIRNLRQFAESMTFMNPQNPDHIWKELLPIFKCRDWTKREAQILNGLFSKGTSRYRALEKKRPKPQ